VAALLTNAGEPLEYLEVVGDGRPLGIPPAPMIAIPTTAGTGTEVTRNAVLHSPRHGVKVSMRHLWMLPRLAVVDPDLTLSLPPALTAATGLDALTQLLEAFVSPSGNPLTEAVCRQGLACAARALRKACRDGGDLAARRDMALASLCGGLALANAKLGAVHGLAAPLGGAMGIPHGVVCGRLLAAVTAANIEALDGENPHSAALARYREAAQILTNDPRVEARTAAEWLRTLVDDLPLAALSEYGPPPTDPAALARQALQASSMKGNPVSLSEARLVRILREAF
jgi:alcohol dehydrogenase class IV